MLISVASDTEINNTWGGFAFGCLEFISRETTLASLRYDYVENNRASWFKVNHFGEYDIVKFNRWKRSSNFNCFLADLLWSSFFCFPFHYLGGKNWRSEGKYWKDLWLRVIDNTFCQRGVESNSVSPPVNLPTQFGSHGVILLFGPGPLGDTSYLFMRNEHIGSTKVQWTYC